MSESDRIPVISIIGCKGCGKTTVLEALIAELTGRGYRVATAKHHAHETSVDAKDTARHGRAGAIVTMVSSPVELAVFRRLGRERTLDELAEAAGDMDILVTEGFRDAARIRIEVVRADVHPEPLSAPADLFALVTDMPVSAPEDVSPDALPTFELDDAKGLADLVEETFLETTGGWDGD